MGMVESHKYFNLALDLIKHPQVLNSLLVKDLHSDFVSSNLMDAHCTCKPRDTYI